MKTSSMLPMAAALALTATACTMAPERSSDHAAPRAQAATRSEVAYRHPLLDAPVRADGRIALVDTIEAEEPGRRYALLHRDSIAENGTETRSSGVVSLRHELHEPSTRPTARAPDLLPTISQHLRERARRLVESGQGDEVLDVTLALRRPDATLTDALRRQIATGAIDSVDDLHEAARQDKAARVGEIRAAVDLVAAAIEAAGGRPGYRCRNAYCLSARVRADTLERLGAITGVSRISEVEPLLPEAGGWDGEDRSEVVQINQFLVDGYDGEQVPGTFRDDIWFAVIEAGNYDDEHPAWGKGGVGWSRVGSRFVCGDGVGCTYIYDFPAPNAGINSERHATLVSGLIFANLTDGQDPDIDVDEAGEFSGFARNALGRLFKANSTLTWDEAMDEIRSFLGPYEHVVNMSQGGTIGCNGDETAAITANALYEDGTLLVKSAGNKSFNPFNPDLCSATKPGAAIGAFTVGGIHSAAGVESMRAAGIWSSSSVGGSENNLAAGRGRTIIDLTASAYNKKAPSPNGIYGIAGYGTSFAAPQVTGAAINFIDHFQHQHFNLEYEPGYLFANLLLMGDRVGCTDQETDCATAETSSRFDRRFGAGRARFRRFDSAGLDAPSHYGTGMIPCLGHSETVDLEIPTDNSFAPMESTIDDFKFVAWWYDRRHELTGTVANVDLRLYEVDPGGNEIDTLVVSDDLYDNKERVYLDSPGGKRLVVEFEGTDTVPADPSWIQAGCTAGEVNVYFAYFAEDDARDDIDGPTWASPYGVEPESVNW